MRVIGLFLIHLLANKHLAPGSATSRQRYERREDFQPRLDFGESSRGRDIPAVVTTLTDQQLCIMWVTVGFLLVVGVCVLPCATGGPDVPQKHPILRPPALNNLKRHYIVFSKTSGKLLTGIYHVSTEQVAKSLDYGKIESSLEADVVYSKEKDYFKDKYLVWVAPNVRTTDEHVVLITSHKLNPTSTYHDYTFSDNGRDAKLPEVYITPIIENIGKGFWISMEIVSSYRPETKLSIPFLAIARPFMRGKPHKNLKVVGLPENLKTAKGILLTTEDDENDEDWQISTTGSGVNYDHIRQVRNSIWHLVETDPFKEVNDRLYVISYVPHDPRPRLSENSDYVLASKPFFQLQGVSKISETSGTSEMSKKAVRWEMICACTVFEVPGTATDTYSCFFENVHGYGIERIRKLFPEDMFWLRYGLYYFNGIFKKFDDGHVVRLISFKSVSLVLRYFTSSKLKEFLPELKTKTFSALKTNRDPHSEPGLTLEIDEHGNVVATAYVADDDGSACRFLYEILKNIK